MKTFLNSNSEINVLVLLEGKLWMIGFTLTGLSLTTSLTLIEQTDQIKALAKLPINKMIPVNTYLTNLTSKIKRDNSELRARLEEVSHKVSSK